jgi:predicted nucleotidyltransferase
MRHNKDEDIISFSNTQKVFSFLVEDAHKEFLASEIQKAADLSKAGVYRALDELVSRELVKKQERWRFVLYSAAANDCVVRQFKVLKTVIALKGPVQKLRASSRKVVLFGSAARGEDYKDSDLDLLIVAKDPEAAQGIVSNFKSGRKIQPVIKTSVQLSEMEAGSREFFNEINSGIVLWEETDES